MAARVFFLAALGVFVAAIALLPDDAARADPPTGTAPSVRVYDVRIVRVITPAPEGVERPCPFLTGAAATIELEWPAILAALKKRGTTRILMDQRLLGTDGVIAKAYAERQDPMTALQSWELRTGTDRIERHAAAVVKTGCKLDVMVDDGRMNVKPEIRGRSDGTAPGSTAPVETLISWDCTQAALDGETLVLTHREQTRGLGDEKDTGVEHYVFVTGRRATR